LSASAQPRGGGDVAAVLARVGEQVQQYYARAVSVICRESVRVQNIGADLAPDGSHVRRLLYELRVAWEPPANGGAPEASVLRDLISIDGRRPRPGDKPGCLDPKPVSPEPLAMLLPEKQGDYTFTWAGTARMDGRPVVMLDYRSKAVAPAAITWNEDCVNVELPGRWRGRVWADQATGEVLRMDERLVGRFDFSVPRDKQRRGGESSMTIERADSSIRYRAVRFRNPDETLLLPVSIETLTIIRNSGAPRVRKIQAFSDYRRFVTEGRVLEP
jgi:hypothetical protein